MRRRVKGHDEIVKEANLPQEIVRKIPREASFDFNDIRSNYKLYIVEVNL